MVIPGMARPFAGACADAAGRKKGRPVSNGNPARSLRKYLRVIM
jgi:hypothetical protein